MSAPANECLAEVQTIPTALVESSAELRLVDSVDGYDRYVVDKKQEFSRLAPLYETLARIATFGIVKRMWRMVAAIASGAINQHVLELCCGTGRVTEHLARKFMRVTGVDLSPAMLQRAKRLVQEQRLGNVDLCEAEVSTLRFEPRTFDALVISLGMHELPGQIRDVVLERAARWLRPGGKIVIFDYRWPVNRLMSAFFMLGRLYFERNHFVDYLNYQKTLDVRLANHGFAPLEKRTLFFSCLEIGVWQKLA